MLAEARIKSRANKRKLRHDAVVCPLEFSVGDLVLVKTHPLSSAEDAEIKKFFLLYEGPFKVNKRLGPNSYELINEFGSVKGNHNIVNLKAYKEIPTIL